jgi:hypothetical protein
MGSVEAQVEPQVEAWEEGDRAGLIGTVVAVALGSFVLGVFAVLQRFGVNSSALFERPDVVAVGLAFSAAMGWRLGRLAGSGGWRRAVGAGLVFGVFWPRVALFVWVMAALVDARLRGTIDSATDVGSAFGWLVYALAIFWLFGSAAAIPFGLGWAFVTRFVARVGSARGTSRASSSTAGFLLAILLIAIAGGTAQAVSYAPWNARCLDLPGGTPTAAAFSPAGNLLAVTVRRDPNAPGTVVLLRWPSGTFVASWSAWVADAVAVDPGGRVYWSAWVLGPFPMGPGDINEGIYTAAAGTAPAWFATGDERALRDLTWTADAIRGTTANSHAIASIPLAGDHSSMDVEPGTLDIGAFWASADGRVTASAPAWFSTAIEIVTKGGGARTVGVSGDPRSIALSPDGRTLVVADWSGGTRLIDVSSGRSRLVLHGSQAFVALSGQGDLAWVNEEQFGHGRLCTSTLAQLGGA